MDIEIKFENNTNKQNELCVYLMQILAQYFKSECYPEDIMGLIINYYHRLFNFTVKYGKDFSLILYDTKVYSRGINNYGVLGVGNTKNKGPLYKIDLINIKEIGCGDNHCVALDYFGNVYIWGYNYIGDNSDIPQKIELKNIKKICCGNNDTFAITYTGEIYSWGQNNYGMLGLGHTRFTQKINKMNLMNVKKIYCEKDYCVALTNNGDIYLWGCNGLGLISSKFCRVCPPTKINLGNIKKICLKHNFVIALDIFGNMHIWGHLIIHSQKDMQNIIDIKCGDEFIFAIDNLNKTYILNGDYGKYMRNTNRKNIKKTYSMKDNIVVINTSNRVYVWGNNQDRQLGIEFVNKYEQNPKLLDFK